MEESNVRLIGQVSPMQSDSVGAIAAALAKAQGEILSKPLFQVQIC